MVINGAQNYEENVVSLRIDLRLTMYQQVFDTIAILHPGEMVGAEEQTGGYLVPFLWWK